MDEQRLEFPQGALGVLKPPTITVADGLEAEIGLVREWREGNLGTMDLMARLEALRMKARRPVAVGP